MLFTGEQTSAAEVLRRFVSLVTCYAFVHEVQVDATPEGVEIWTVIEAEPFAFEPRSLVYDAELQATDVAPDAPVSFRLINSREYPGKALDQVTPEGGLVAWRRAPRS